MAAKIQLDITTAAHIDGIEKAQQALNNLKAGGNEFNNALKTGNVNAVGASIMKTFHNTSLWKNELLASKEAVGSMAKAMKTLTPLVQTGQLNFVDDKGIAKQITSVSQLSSYFTKMQDEVTAYADSYAKSMVKSGEVFSMAKFSDKLDLNAEAARRFGSEMKAIETQMAMVSEQGTRMTLAGGDPEAIKQLSERYNTLKTQMASLKEVDFEGDLTRSAEAAKMFGGDMKSLEVQMSMISQQGQSLIKSGTAERSEIEALSTRYNDLKKQHLDLQKAQNGTGTRIKNLIKNFVSAQLIVYAIRKAWQLLTSTIRDSAQAANDAQETYNLYITTFQNLESVAQNTASTLATQFGLANSSAQQSIGIFGDMSIGFGQTTSEAIKFADEASRLVMDLISFKNVQGDTTDIMQKFSSGLAGNVENFRRYGIIVRATDVDRRLAEKGLDKLTGSALESAKMQERLNIAIEQSPNAVGDMIRTFDSAQNVQRRLSEETKRYKENLGTELLPMFTKVRLAILELMNAQNMYYEAKRNQEKGTDAGAPLVNLDTEEGIEKAKKTLEKFFSTQQGTFTKFGKTTGIDIEEIDAAARAYGITLEQVADIALNQDSINSELQTQITLGDIRLKQERDEKRAIEAKKNALVEYSQKMGNLVEDFSGAAKTTSKWQKGINDALSESSNKTLSNLAINDIITEFTGKDITTFADALDNAIGAGEMSDALEEKQKLLEGMFDTLNNAKITAESSGDTVLAENLEESIKKIVDLYMGVTNEIAKIDYDKQFEQLQAVTKSLEYQNLLEKTFGEENTEIVNLYKQQRDEELEALRLKQERITKTGNEADAEADYQRTMEEITKQYDLQFQILYSSISLEEMKTSEKEKQENIERDITAQYEAQLQIQDLLMSNQSKRVELGIGYSLSPQESASNARDQELSEAKKTLFDFASSLYDPTLAKGYTEENLKKINSMRLELEEQAELNYQLSLKDARDASLENIESMWEGLGDVGMIKEWMETFTNVKEYAQTEAGGNLSAEEASDLATGKVITAIILEFASHVEVLDEVMSIVTTIFEEFGPIVSDFLEPLIPIIKIIVSMLNMFIPILELLFPFMKMFAIAIVMILTPFQQLAAVIQYAIGKITFWTKSDDIAWSEVQNIQEENMQTISDIWSMEIDARAEYVSDLTEAQKGEIEAYKKMYQSGQITGSEYEALVNKNVYGRTTGLTSVTDLASSSSSYTTITYGDITIAVSGEGFDEAELAQQIGAEIAKLSRKGIE